MICISFIMISSESEKQDERFYNLYKTIIIIKCEQNPAEGYDTDETS